MRDTSPYPFAYRLQGAVVPVLVILGGLVVACGLFGVYWAYSSLVEHGQASSLSAFKLLLLCILSTAMGAWMIVTPFAFRMIVREDCLEERYVFRTKRLARREIAGKTVYPPGGMIFYRTVVIYPIDRGDTPMKIEMHFRDTEVFDEWISSIPDMDPSAYLRDRKTPRLLRNFQVSIWIGVPALSVLASMLYRHFHV